MTKALLIIFLLCTFIFIMYIGSKVEVETKKLDPTDPENIQSILDKKKFEIKSKM